MVYSREWSTFPRLLHQSFVLFSKIMAMVFRLMPSVMPSVLHPGKINVRLECRYIHKRGKRTGIDARGHKKQSSHICKHYMHIFKWKGRCRKGDFFRHFSFDSKNVTKLQLYLPRGPHIVSHDHSHLASAVSCRRNKMDLDIVLWRKMYTVWNTKFYDNSILKNSRTRLNHRQEKQGRLRLSK